MLKINQLLQETEENFRTFLETNFNLETYFVLLLKILRFVFIPYFNVKYVCISLYINPINIFTSFNANA